MLGEGRLEGLRDGRLEGLGDGRSEGLGVGVDRPYDENDLKSAVKSTYTIA